MVPTLKPWQDMDDRKALLAACDDAIVYTHPEALSPAWQRLISTGAGFGLGVLLTAVASAQFFRTVSHVLPFLAAGGFVGALLAAVLPWSRKYTSARLGRTEVVLSTTDGKRAVLRYDEIDLLVGKAGLSLSGGPMRVFDRVCLAAGGRRHTVRLGPPGNAACFDLLEALCPHALAVRWTGRIRLPGVPDGTEPARWLGSLRPAVKGLFRRRALAPAAGAAVAAVATGAVVIALVGTESPPDPAGGTAFARAVVNGVILAASAAVLGAIAVGQALAGRRVLRDLARLQDQAVRNPGLAVERVVLGPVERPPGPAGALAKILTFLSLVTAIFPVVGLLVALAAWAATRGTTTWWAHPLTKVALTIALASSVIALFVVASDRRWF